MANKPDNPAYITVSSQLASTQSEIASIKKQMAMAERKRDEYRRRIQSSPRVEEGYRALIGERNNLQSKYDDLMKKYMETKVASGLEKGQMGERFTLIDPPRLPEKPVRPNIPAILLIGCFLGIGGGVGAASLREYSDQSVRSARQVTAVTSVPVLATIPEIVTWEDRVRSTIRRKRVIVGVVLALVIGVMAFHFFIMDLDVAWARMMRKLRL